MRWENLSILGLIFEGKNDTYLKSNDECVFARKENVHIWNEFVVGDE